MYFLNKSLIPFLSTITLPDTPFRQFDLFVSCLSFTICFAVRKFHFDAYNNNTSNNKNNKNNNKTHLMVLFWDYPGETVNQSGFTGATVAVVSAGHMQICTLPQTDA